MKNNQINRVINLVRKTGDRVVVMDQETEEVLVMMRLDEYENLMDFALPGGESGPMPDFESWDHEAEGMVAGDESDEQSFDLADHAAELKSREAVAPVAAVNEKKLEFSEDWEKPVSTNVPEEDLSDVPEDEEEPRFYLEPVE